MKRCPRGAERTIIEDVDLNALAESGKDPIPVLQPLGEALFEAKVHKP
jgi:hypothetical protein